MAFSSVLQMYLGWANSLLCEQGVLIDGLHQLRDGSIFCHLIELLTGTQLLPAVQDALSSDTLAVDNVQTALDYLTGVGVKISINAEDVVHGELKSILDVLWSIILHCTIHSSERAAYQRTVRSGRKLLLQWCGEELGINIDTNKSMSSIFSGKNHLSDLLSLHCSFENNKDAREKYLVNLTNGILAAEDHFGISKILLGPADVINGIADEHSLMIYIALLRRKVSMLSSRHCSLSSDEDESAKISPKKQSPNASLLSMANSVYSVPSSFSSNYSNLSTPQPPHHRHAPDYSLDYKPSPVDSSLSRATTQDVTPEKSDSGISTSADAPSLSSSSLPSSTSSRLKELREHRMDWRGNQGAGHGATPARSMQSRQDIDSCKDATEINHGAASSRRNETRDNERRFEDVTSVLPRMSDLRVNSLETRNSTNYPLPSCQNYHLSGHDEQGVVSSSDEQLTREESGRKKDDENGDGEGLLVDHNKDSDAEDDKHVQTPEDELLHLLDTIGKESQHLRLELNETQQREAILKTQLEEETVGGTEEENVISKLVQELEMLRNENRRLFRESANAKNANALDRKTMEKLAATIGKLQIEVEHQNAENFNMRMKSKIGSDLGLVDASRGRDIVRDGIEEMGRLDHSFGSRETPELCDLKRDLARAESRKEFLQTRLNEMEEQMKRKLNQSTEDFRTSRLENLRLEKECKLLRMSNETSRLEVETVAGRCRRLEEYLSHAQKRNNRLAQQLEEETLQASSQDKNNQTLAFVAKLEEENALLKKKVELAEEERELLKQELAHYRLNKVTLDEVLRAWDVQTSSKFQSFLDNFRLHINEQREHQDTKRTKTPEMETQRVKDGEKQASLTERQDHKEIVQSARSTSSIKSESSDQVSGGQEAVALASREPVLKTNNREETKLLTAENLTAVARSQAVVDDKYLQISPRSADTDTEVDSEMDSQTTDDAFSDLPDGYINQEGRSNQMAAAGGIAKTKLSDGFRRPSLGDLIVAKAQNSAPGDANGKAPDRNSSKMAHMEPKSKKDVEDIDQGAAKMQVENSDAQSARGEPSRDCIPKSHVTGKTRFSAVSSSLESLRGITKKAKLNPDKSSVQEEDKGVSVPQEMEQNDVKMAALSWKQEEDYGLKAGGDNRKGLEKGAVKITNGYSLDFQNQTVNKATYDSRSLPEIEPPSLQIHQRVGLVRGRFSRWRRMQNRFQPSLDGSYLDGYRVGSDLVQDSSSEQIQEGRNRSSSLGSPLNSVLGGQNGTKSHPNELEDSEMGTNSVESEEEFVRLPERRNVAQDHAFGNSRVGEDLKLEKPSQRERADGTDKSKMFMNGHGGGDGAMRHQEEPEMSSQVRATPLGNASKPQFSSPQRLGYLRSKLGIKLERELLNSSSSFRDSLNEEQKASSSRTGDSEQQPSSGHPSETRSTNQVQPLKPDTIQSTSTNNEEKQNHSKSTPSPEMQNLKSNNNEMGNEILVPVSNTSSPDVSKMSPASYNQYYKHKMMAEKDQEYANSIIDKYLNQI